MAISITTNSYKKLDIVHKIIGYQFSRTDEERVDVENIWCHAHMLSSDELVEAMRDLTQKSSSFSVNYPIWFI